VILLLKTKKPTHTDKAVIPATKEAVKVQAQEQIKTKATNLLNGLPNPIKFIKGLNYFSPLLHIVTTYPELMLKTVSHLDTIPVNFPVKLYLKLLLLLGIPTLIMHFCINHFYSKEILLYF
jgi:hypothetical protein